MKIFSDVGLKVSYMQEMGGGGGGVCFPSALNENRLQYQEIIVHVHVLAYHQKLYSSKNLKHLCLFPLPQC